MRGLIGPLMDYGHEGGKNNLASFGHNLTPSFRSHHCLPFLSQRLVQEITLK
jgi:hypothetical protein